MILSISQAAPDDIARAFTASGIHVEHVTPTQGHPPTVWVHVIKDGHHRSYGFDPRTPLPEVTQQIANDLLPRSPN